MELSAMHNLKLGPKFLLKWAVVAIIVLVNLYADICMYLNGDIAYPLLDLVLVGVGVYVFVSKKMYAQRYAFPSRYDCIYHFPSNLHSVDLLY